MKTRLYRLLPAAFLPLAASVPAVAQDAGNAERGAELYQGFGCYQCHQYSGAGYLGVPGGAPLVPLRFPLEAFIAYIRNPPVPNRMPPYTETVLSREQAADIHAFIESLPRPRAKEEIELLNSIIGEIEEADQEFR